MLLRDFQSFQNAVLIGQILLGEAVRPSLEAFSGNALYCWRGMPTMNKYKTVKEVCALTGLTRKHLYYLHHQNIVRATAYANYSVEGHNGYKLYDDAAVEKLQQTALCYELGLSLDEIRDIVMRPDYDSDSFHVTVLALMQEKALHIQRSIAALEYLILAGTRNGASGSVRGISLDDLGRILLAIREMSGDRMTSSDSYCTDLEAFLQEFQAELTAFSRLDAAQLATPAGTEMIRQILELCTQRIGIDGVPFALGLFMSALGGGSAAQKISDGISNHHARAVIQYIVAHPEIYTPSAQDTTIESAGK